MVVVLGTRIHNNSAKCANEFYLLKNWCYQALEYTNYIVVATDSKSYTKTKRAIRDLGERVHTILVSPWKGIVNPLNSIICEANILGAERLVFQSVEVYISSRDFEILNYHLKSDTLVVGGKMVLSHGGTPGTKVICGMTSPWNTLALWNLAKLNTTGFLGVSNGIIKGIPGGIEEVPTISLLQQLYPNETQAKLVSLSDLSWITIWKDKKRENYHKEKMLTKSSRAEAQLNCLKIKPGYVTVF
ncbi:hypothetical protein [Nostoc sp. NMS4]|uniref:hypothetical protein n=1 Tax=Nostoc sp. NMS4 TaxID=2815390 RepID=UPI0025FEEAFC|nr:hypothetical protein [Nostoc sp. NMS4]MBN3925421.1 hypothetical protein [Nostoc sp. NMS4]